MSRKYARAALEAAKHDVWQLTSHDFARLSQIKKPHPLVKMTLRAVMLVLKRATGWLAIQKALVIPFLKREIYEYRPEMMAPELAR